jgi:hypothetical protein
MPRLERLADIPLLQSKPRFRCKMGQVIQVSCREVVNAENGVALAKQTIGEV